MQRANGLKWKVSQRKLAKDYVLARVASWRFYPNQRRNRMEA